nr:homologous recombination OB-fold protein isoform X2 [Anser cygnoides]
MAVMIKSLTRTNVDAGAVFRDPTGTARPRCPRAGSELRPRLPAALSSQVGVFSPSHRNHYLNVTPANLLRIYPPEPEGSLSQPEVPAPAGSLQEHPAPIPRDLPGPADWGPPGTGSHGPQQPPGGLWLQPRSHEPGHGEHGGADSYDMGPTVAFRSPSAPADDLDGLLGELPEDFFSAPAQADCC